MKKLIALTVLLLTFVGPAMAAEEGTLPAPKEVRNTINKALILGSINLTREANGLPPLEADNFGAISSLVGRTDASGNLVAISVTASGSGDMRAIGSLIGRTDSTGALYVAGVPGGSFPVLAPDGAVGAPSYSFVNEATLGFYRLAAGVIGASGPVSSTVGFRIANAATSGAYLIGNGTNFVSLTPAMTEATPADQTGNATATFKMNGLGAAGAPCTITPTSTGRVTFYISGDIAQSTTADGVTLKVAFGTGAAPANAAAATGTVIGSTRTWTALTGMLQVPITLQASTTGLALVATWFDVQIADVTGGTASIKNVTCTAVER